MSTLLTYVLLGIPVGCVYALLATGLTLTYKTSGVLNLAFGAQAFVSATLYYKLVTDFGWPAPLAAFLAIVVLGPLIGFLLNRALYRHLRTAPALAKLVTSLGLLVAIPEITKLVFGSQSLQRAPGLITSDAIYRFGPDLNLSMDQIVTMGCTAVVVAGLTILFRATNLGLQMRAVVESPRMTELAGVNADRVAGLSWMLSSLLAALAGVLLAPLFANVSDLDFFNLLVAALAAAVFARLVSIPLAMAGGLMLGIIQAVLAGYLPSTSVVAKGLRPALPFVLLFLLLIAGSVRRRHLAAIVSAVVAVTSGAVLLLVPMPTDTGAAVGVLLGASAGLALLLLRPATTGSEVSDPLRGVDPPPPAPPAAIRSRGLTIATRSFAVIFVVGASLLCLLVFNDSLLELVIKGLILGLIFLSFFILTGLGGQISLCQASFAAIGAFGTAQLVKSTGMSVLAAMCVAAVIAAAVGAVVALPALRLAGIYLALATLAFAIMFQEVLLPLDWIGGSRAIKVPRPLIGPVDFASNKTFYLLVVVLLGIFAGIVLLIRHGTSGRFLEALRGSETAAASLGINPATAKITAFATSAFIAGFGGGLLASFSGTVNRTFYDANFTYFFGLVWLVLVISLGARSVQAAINAGVSFLIFPWLLAKFIENYLPKIFVFNDSLQTWAVGLAPESTARAIAFILFGFGAITYAKHPEGIIEANTRKSVEKMMRMINRRSASGEPPEAGAPVDGTGGRREAPEAVPSGSVAVAAATPSPRQVSP